MAFSIAFLIGRVIIGLYWLQVAYGHVFKGAGMVGYIQSKGIKSAVLSTKITARLTGRGSAWVPNRP